MLGGTNSYALGTVYIALTLNKMLILNKNGIISKGLNSKKISHLYMDDIKKLEFNEFREIVLSGCNFNREDDNTILDIWKKPYLK